MPDQRDEMVRGFEAIDKRFDRLEQKFDGFVGRAEYEEAQRHIDTHIRALQGDAKDNRDEIGKVMKTVKAIAEREDDRRQLRTQVFVGPIISGVVVGLTVAILLAVVGLR